MNRRWTKKREKNDLTTANMQAKALSHATMYATRVLPNKSEQLASISVTGELLGETGVGQIPLAESINNYKSCQSIS